jgi:hypothetical protein
MDKAAYGSRLPKKAPKNLKRSEAAKNNPAHLANLAAVRTGTQLGGPNIERCQKLNASGTQCGCRVIRGEKVCFNHASGRVLEKLKARRLAEGRPVDRADKIATRNVKELVRANKLDRDLMLQPVFQSLMRLVAPRWFGQQPTALGKQITQHDLRSAALLAREMVLAWEAAKGGDMLPWTNAVMKARQLGYEGGRTPFD